MRLEERFGDLAGEAGDVRVESLEGRDEYRRAGELFVVVERTPGATTIELRLLPDVAEAARRTPNTRASTRGDEWISFAPTEWDQHATDRLEAWFRVAWRLSDG